jgi:hypothetical protein
MIINRENYEAFLLDLMEGNLSRDEENILRHFLKENPDLIAEGDLTEFSISDSGKIPVSGIKFPMKDGLKKGGLNSEINAGNYEQFCIARLEGDLSAHAGNLLEVFLSENPGLRKSAEIFGHTILKADRSVIFPQKHLLKKVTEANAPVKGYFTRKLIYMAVSVAASVTILISVFNFLSDSLMNDQGPDRANQELSIADGQLTKPGPSEAPVSGTPGDGLSDESAEIAGREPGETTRARTGLPQTSPAVKKETVVSQHFASREPVLLPAGNIIPKEIKTIQTNFSPEIVRPAQYAIQRDYQITENERSGAGTFITGLLSFATRNVIDNEDVGAGLNLWNIADAGFRGINSITGADLRLEREFNQDGELVSMAFSSRVIEFRRTSYGKDN